MVEAAKGGVTAFADSIVRTDTEVILAIGPDGQPAMSTRAIELRSEELPRIAGLVREGRREFMTLPIGGVQRVARGFPFAPFGWYMLVTEERAVFYSDIDVITRYTGLIVLAASALSIVLLTLFARRLTSPLARVADTMESIISENDLTARVPVEYRDETGRLAHTFNIMIGELDKAYQRIKGYALEAVLAQKKERKIRSFFQKFVPPHVIDQMVANPESMLVGDNRPLAILFSDIRGFTTISEGMLPDDLVNSLNRYFATQVDIVIGRGGIVDKYLGDAIMAFFGAPVAREDDPLQAVLAGIEMTEAVVGFNARQRELGKPEFKIGVGIAYGEVTVGNIGTDKKMDYTVIGDTVNLGSRLEGLTKVYHQPMLISDTLRDPVKDRVPTRLIDAVAVKGKTKGVRIYTAKKELSETEARAWKLHDEAMERYYSRAFAEAEPMFSEVLALLPGDPTSEEMIERCRRYRSAPPPEDWDGVEVMTTK
jgi:class 3 adenylate cyclase/HAMP domain-containing protein